MSLITRPGYFERVGCPGSQRYGDGCESGVGAVNGDACARGRTGEGQGGICGCKGKGTKVLIDPGDHH